MNNLLTKAEKKRIAKTCKDNPYKSFKILEQFCKELKIMSVRDFAKISTKSERTIYNMVKDTENAEIEILSIFSTTFIPALLNKDILK